MDLSQLAGLLPDFLQSFKGKNSQNLPELFSAVGNTGMLENFIGEKYTKYLPLLPLLGKLGTDGLKGLLSDTDAITAVLSALSGSVSPELLKGVSLESLAPLVPIVAGLFKDGGGLGGLFKGWGGAQKGTPADSAAQHNAPNGNTAQQQSTPTNGSGGQHNWSGNDSAGAITLPAPNLSAQHISPLSPVSEFAGRDVTYMLNRYISRDE